MADDEGGGAAAARKRMASAPTTQQLNCPQCGFHPGFNLPTGPVKPAGSGTGIPDRFGRKPVETGQIQIRLFNRFRPAYRSI